MQCKQEIKYLELRTCTRTSNSPDANPVENLWSIIKHYVEKRKAINLEELNKFLHEE